MIEHAIFPTPNGAHKIMGKVPWFKGRTLVAKPTYKRGEILGYKVYLCGKPLTEDSVALLMGQKGVLRASKHV